MYCADVCVTGAPEWHTVSLSETVSVASSDLSNIHKFGEKLRGRGSEHEDTCMWTKFMYEKGGLIFKYQMQLQCGTYLAKRTILLAPTPLVSAQRES